MATKIEITLPRTWAELTDTQLYDVYKLIALNTTFERIKVLCFMRWADITLLARDGEECYISHGKTTGTITTRLLHAATASLDWLTEPPKTPVRITSIKGHYAIDATLQDAIFPVTNNRFDFEKYLYCDNLYQGYLDRQDNDLLNQMGQLLYDAEELTLTNAERISIFYWWTSLKTLFANTFTNFLVPALNAEQPQNLTWQRLQETMNAQIRALTGGDITKRKEVLAMDVWPVMWELDAKAKDYNDMMMKYGK